MKLYLWRNMFLGAMSFVYAESVEEARDLLREVNKAFHSDVVEAELSNLPEVYETSKAFTLWADTFDLDE